MFYAASHMKFAYRVSLTCALLASLNWAQHQQPNSDDIKGTLSDLHVYKNPTLAMTLALPGEWQFLEQQTKASDQAKAQPQSNCQGPLCGNPDIDVALLTRPGPQSNVSTIFMIAFKLSPPYLDRRRFPLSWFASAMLPGSLNHAGLVPAGNMTAVTLDGRPGYRLLVRPPNEDTAKEFGYVAESNGYVFMLVGAVSVVSDLPRLQSAVENMKIGRSQTH